MDQGWLVPKPSDVVNPFAPTQRLWWWQCADIKIDAWQPGPPPFFQTDPEGPLPLSHVLFDLLVDNSQQLPTQDQAMVHVQVHSRTLTAIDNVNVWAIFTRASGGVPGLDSDPSSGDHFPFWNQFLTNGDIVVNLPSDSRWTSVGAPVTLHDIDAAHPRVASWPWTVPTLTAGDNGHYCIVVFVHSANYPIGETSVYNVDSLVPSNPQIGQKNLHIM
jgi:hypothetical protein